MVIKLRDLEKVVGHARHQRTDLLIVIETEGQLLIMREKLISQVVFHPRADHVTDVGDEVITAELDSEKSEHDKEQIDDRLRRVGKAFREYGSCDVSYDQRDNEGCGGTDEGEAHVRDKALHVGSVI